MATLCQALALTYYVSKFDTLLAVSGLKYCIQDHDMHVMIIVGAGVSVWNELHLLADGSCCTCMPWNRACFAYVCIHLCSVRHSRRWSLGLGRPPRKCAGMSKPTCF